MENMDEELARFHKEISTVEAHNSSLRKDIPEASADKKYGAGRLAAASGREGVRAGTTATVTAKPCKPGNQGLGKSALVADETRVKPSVKLAYLSVPSATSAHRSCRTRPSFRSILNCPLSRCFAAGAPRSSFAVGVNSTYSICGCLHHLHWNALCPVAVRSICTVCCPWISSGDMLAIHSVNVMLCR